MPGLILTRLYALPKPAHRVRTQWFTSSAAVLGLKVLFFGSDEFSARALRALHENTKSANPAVSHIEVVCPPPQHKKRGKKMKVEWRATSEKWARRLLIPVHYCGGNDILGWDVPPTGEEFGHHDRRFDIGVVASYGAFIPPRIMNQFPKGMINLHPSLLPEYRGPTPIQTAILDGQENSGVTVQEMHPTRYDAGRILAQVPCKILLGMTRLDLMHLMGHMGGELASRVLGRLDLVRQQSQEQDESRVTKTRLYAHMDLRVNWETMSAMDIMRMHWAHYGHINVWTFLRLKNKILHVKLLELSLPKKDQKPLEENFLDLCPGTIMHRRLVPYLEIPCIDGGRIHATRFVVASKQPCDRFQFAAGYIKKNKTARFLSQGDDVRRPQQPFRYPEGYQKPDLEHALRMYDTPMPKLRQALEPDQEPSEDTWVTDPDAQ
ncbi:Methionyl-tRNA formyltransferase [Coemansia sp. RSA 2711]|nr:Methionyl-tRNA formyltransferase [Coemansia sp. RSA 2711]